MTPFITSALYFEELEMGRTEHLAYWVGQNRRSGGHLFQAKLKFPRGIRYLVAGTYERPRIEQIIDQCSRFGSFSARPYQLGQASSGSTDACAMALYQQCCSDKGLDPTQLIVETYPGWERVSDWTSSAWAAINDQAAWEGYDSPPSWDLHALKGLFKSLVLMHRPMLVSTLLDRLAGQPILRDE